MKVRMMKGHPQVCFEIDEIKNHGEWRSVVVYGTFEEIRDEAEKWEALRGFAARMLPVKVSESARPPLHTALREHHRPEIHRTIVYRINIEEMTGRYENSLDSAFDD